MEEKERTQEDIQKDYEMTCMELGHINFLASNFSKNALALHEKLNKLNLESAALKEKQKVPDETI